VTTWTEGSPEPHPNVRAVTDRDGTTWKRSTPNGLWWYPENGGIIHHWPELPFPVTEAERVGQLSLLDLLSA
jgi:hypothetical protein